MYSNSRIYNFQKVLDNLLKRLNMRVLDFENE